MGEYEDRYPDAFGRGEDVDPEPARRHFWSFGLPRQVRDDLPAEPVRPAQGVEHTRPALVARPPREIYDDVSDQLNASPFIDASGISISVDGTEVTLAGTINSLTAISLAQALVSNIPGVGRVQVQLRVHQTPRIYETAGKTAGE